MKTPDRYLVTNPEALQDGKQFIKVFPISQNLRWHIITVHGQPFQPSSPTLRDAGVLFVGASHTSRDAGPARMKLDLRDCNVIPNSYNMSSLWEYHPEVRAWLASLQQRGPEGFHEYIAVLKRQDRGGTINTNARNEYAFW